MLACNCKVLRNYLHEGKIINEGRIFPVKQNLEF